MAKKPITVLIDLDGYIANFTSAAIKVLKKAGVLPVGFSEANCDRWKWYDKHCSTSAFWAALNQEPDFWTKRIKAYPHAWSHVNNIGLALADVLGEDTEFKMLYCTTPGPTSASYAGKVDWLVANNLVGNAASTHIRMTTDKSELAHSRAILIDDKPENVNDFRAAGGKAILVPRPWNRHADEHKSNDIANEYRYVMGMLRSMLVEIVDTEADDDDDCECDTGWADRQPIKSPHEYYGNSLLTTDDAERKRTTLYRTLFRYFPRALAAVAKHGFESNEKHNPGEEPHWAREKSSDHPDCLLRHTLEEEWIHVAWRALAQLELEEEKRLGVEPPCQQ